MTAAEEPPFLAAILSSFLKSNNTNAMDTVALPIFPSCHNCLSWSNDGELAVAAGEYVHVLVRFHVYPTCRLTTDLPRPPRPSRVTKTVNPSAIEVGTGMSRAFESTRSPTRSGP